jgi:hypothetical protein
MRTAMLNEDLISIEEIESISPGAGVLVTHLHCDLLKRLCDTAIAAHYYRAILTGLDKTVFNIQIDES